MKPINCIECGNPHQWGLVIDVYNVFIPLAKCGPCIFPLSRCYGPIREYDEKRGYKIGKPLSFDIEKSLK